MGLVAKSFNADFYVTSATVIPVLFLAVAVQGRTYESVMRAARSAAKESGHGGWRRRFGPWAASQILQLIACGIMLAGGIGEFLALVVLYRGYERAGDRPMVLAGTLVLVGAAVASPWLGYGRLRRDLDVLRYQSHQAAHARGKAAEPPADLPDE